MIDALKKISSPSVANAIETFNVRPRNHGNMSSEIRTLFTELGPLVGYAVTAVIRAEPQPLEGHRASTFGWWDYVLSIPAPRVIVVHDLDEPRGQGAQWGEVQANIHRALGCAGVITDGSVRDLDEVRALGFQFAAAHVSVSHAYVHGRLRLADQGGRAVGEAGRSGSRRPARRRYDSDRHRRADPRSGRKGRGRRA